MLVKHGYNTIFLFAATCFRHVTPPPPATRLVTEQEPTCCNRGKRAVLRAPGDGRVRGPGERGNDIAVDCERDGDGPAPDNRNFA